MSMALVLREQVKTIVQVFAHEIIEVVGIDEDTPKQGRLIVYLQENPPSS